LIPGDPNVGNVELVAAALGDLASEVVLVGGCAASLLIESPTAPPPRITYDVDLVAVVAALRDYHALEKRIAERGFTRDASPDAPICRWCLREVKVDLMPDDERILGFSNPWYPEAVATATPTRLPSGAVVRLITAPAFLATKFEAFRTRGNSDLAASHDFEDIVNVIEGRPAIVTEARTASPSLRRYLEEQFSAIAANTDYLNVLPGLIAFDDLHAERLAAVADRIAALSTLKDE
jgi:predicted nucleotidyltransferase